MSLSMFLGWILLLARAFALPIFALWKAKR